MSRSDAPPSRASLSELAEEYGLEPEDLVRPPDPPASHLSEADEAFLAAVTGRASHKGIVVERELERHYATADALGVVPTIEDADVPEPGTADEYWDQSARTIRGRTRELQRQARAAAVAAARKPGK